MSEVEKIQELLLKGTTLSKLRFLGYSASAFHKLGYAVEELKRVGYSSAELLAAGYLPDVITDKQPLNSALTEISDLSPINDDILQRKGGIWVNRTPSQVKTDLALTKSDVGLSNVDNTSDVNKPVSTATQNALNTKQDTLVSGTNIKTVNSTSLLGSGDITQTTVSGNAGTATALQTARNIGGVSFDGTIDITPQTIQVANEATDTTCFPCFFTAATGNLQPKSNTGLTFNSNNGVLASTGFSGPLTGDVTGNVSGSSGSCTGNSATVTGLSVTAGKTLTVTRSMAFGAVDDTGIYTLPAGTKTLLATDGSAANLTSFPTFNQNTTGTAAIATTVTVADESVDTTCFICFLTAATGNLGPKTNTTLTYNSSTGNLSSTLFSGVALKTDQGATKFLDGTGAYSTPTAAAANQNPNLLVQGADYNLLSTYGMVCPEYYEIGSGFVLDIADGGILDIV